MGKRFGSFCIAAGAALIVSALLLSAYNRWDGQRAQRESAEVLEELCAALEKPAPLPSDEPEDQTEPVIHVDGYDYIGYLSIPSVDLRQPVMAQWDEDRLKKAPCRQFGTLAGDDLVIAGHNYKDLFGRLLRVETGSEISFTDAAGQTVWYQVVEAEAVEPSAVDRVRNSGYDLVLYTCTLSGKTRAVLFCDRAEPD